MSQAEITRFCGSCGSPAVDVSSIEGAEASCRSCGWKGPSEALLNHAFQHDFMSKEEVLKSFTNDVRTVLAKDAGVPLLKLLMKWGFLGKPDPRSFGIYLAAIGKAIVIAVLEVREDLEKGKKAS